MILDQIGAGAMGLVFTAYDPDLDRKVAIKLLKPEQHSPLDPKEARARMLREAQAMARVSHPNVVGVHEVGTFEDRVFMVMELVEGTTLTAWLVERERHWSEVVRVFIDAGRGLVAAHEAGLVHRDFKPDNVLIGTDERIRVTDFGLVGRSASDGAEATVEAARRDRAAPATGAEAVKKPGSGCSQALGTGAGAGVGPGREGGQALATADTVSESGSALELTLTRTGTLLGTPRYMAPEQFACHPVDGRTDQFSYCIALYEALYGERPFSGKTLRELVKNVSEGVLTEPARDAQVPAWLEHVLRRGLAAAPERRYPSMAELLADLDRKVDGRRRWWLVSAGIVAVLALVLAYFRITRVEGTAPPLCQGAAEKLADIWDDDAKQRLAAGFAAAGVAYAEDAARRVEAVIDGYTAAWVVMRGEACAATHIRGEQSAELLDLRMTCLDRRAEELRALVTVLAAADAATVEEAVDAAYGLTPLDVCADVEALTAPTPAPVEPHRRARLGELHKQLAEAVALQAIGKFEQASAVCEKILGPARALGHRPFLAEVLLRYGATQAQAGEADAAATALMEATEQAEAGKADPIAAEAWVQLVFVVGFLQRDYPHAAMWRARAEAAIQRLAGTRDQATEPARIEELRGRLLLNAGAVRYRESKFENARDDWQRALELWTRALGPDHPDLIRVLNNLAAVTDLLGDRDLSHRYSEQAVAIAEKTIGEDHPHYGSALDGLAGTARLLGQHEESLALFERALAIRRRTLGDQHPDVAKTLHNMGNTLLRMGRLDQALAAFREALAIHELTEDNDEDIAITLVSIGSVLAMLGQFEPAIASHQRALELLVQARGPEHYLCGYPHVGLGEVYVASTRFRDALEHHRQALEIWETSLGADSRNLAHPLTGIGLAHLGLGAAARARPPLERALALREGDTRQAGELAQTRFALARALWHSRPDRARALELARQARAGFAADGEASRAELARSQEWLAAHDKAR